MSTKTLTVRTVDDWTTPHPGADNVRIEVDELVSRTDLGRLTHDRCVTGLVPTGSKS